MRPHAQSALFHGPVLRADAMVRVTDDRHLEVELGDEVYTLSGLAPRPLAQALNLLDGAHALADVSERFELPLSGLDTVVARLLAAGVVNHSPMPDAAMKPAEFARLCRSMFVPWKARLFDHPLWRGLVAGTLDRRVFVGWAVESYWFIEGVIDRLPMAAACSENRSLRAVFAHHFSEEWDHFHFFARTLDALDVTAEQRRIGQPLPSTRAILHWMRAAARQDPLRYAACSGFLESTGTDRASAREFFDKVGQCYDTPDRKAVTPMAEHVSLDEDYGHGSMIENVADCFAAIPRERAGQALQSAYGLVETLEMWSSDILRHYAAPTSLPLTSPRIYRGRDA